MNRSVAMEFPALEQEIEAALHRTPLPDPAPLPESAVDIGRMSAEAVLAQYEIAAKANEEMGHEVKDRIARLEAAMAECDKDLKIIAECAQMIRDKGRLVQVQIEEASALSHDIREACIEFKRKVGT